MFPKLRAESQDFLHLDCLRIIAAIGVVLFHYRHNWFLLPTSVTDRLEGFSIFVDLFFAISGVIICHAYYQMRGNADYFRFLQKRIARIVPLHWLTLAFYAVLGLVALKSGMHVKDADKYDWGCLVPNALLIHAFGVCKVASFNNVSWSLSGEMAVYLLFPVFLLGILRRPAMMVALALSMLCGLYLMFPASRPWYERVYDFGGLRAFPAFIIGMAAWRWRSALGRLLPPVLVYLLLTAFIAGVLAQVSKAFLAPLTYLIVIAGVAADQRKPSSLIKWLAPLGQLTFGVYMLHDLIRTVIITTLGERILRLDPMRESILTMACVPVVLVAAYLSLVLFERPTRRWISRLGLPAAKPVVLQSAPRRLGGQEV